MGYIAQGTQTGIWSPTWSGFSSPPTPTGTCNYSLNGKNCTCYIRATSNGTSNANTFTVTLPFAADNNAVQTFMIQITDNNVQALGRLQTASASNIATLAPSVTAATTGWTTSGNKSTSFCITYIIQ